MISNILTSMSSFPFRNKYTSSATVKSEFKDLCSAKKLVVHSKWAADHIDHATKHDGKKANASRFTRWLPEIFKDNYDMIANDAGKIAIMFVGDHYDRWDRISDYFNENVRMEAQVAKAKKKNFIEFYDSPLKVWDANGKQIKTMKNKSKNQTDTKKQMLNMQRELFWHATKNNKVGAKEAGTARPAIMKGLIEYFGAESVFDPSMGWGDRLVGALASRGLKEYYGTDPNDKLHSGYDEIIKTFAGQCKKNKLTKHKVVHSDEPFEIWFADNKKKFKNHFDLVHTSPPYFMYERYVNPKQFDHSSKQSISTFSDPDDWTNKWLIKELFENSVALAKKHGHIAFAIEDQPFHKGYVAKLIAAGENNSHVRFKQIIFHIDKTRSEVKKIKSFKEHFTKLRWARPIYVWEKVK